MCEPTTLIAAATVFATAGTVVKGVNTAKSLKYGAKVADQNAAMDRAAARDALERGRIEERNQYRRNAQRMGALRANLAANGIETDFGSAADLQSDAAMIGWEDAQTVRENAMRESRGYEIRAWNSSADAASKRAGAKAAMWEMVFDAGSTMLGGAQQYRKAQADKATGGGSNFSSSAGYPMPNYGYAYGRG